MQNNTKGMHPVKSLYFIKRSSDEEIQSTSQKYPHSKMLDCFSKSYKTKCILRINGAPRFYFYTISEFKKSHPSY